MKSAESTHRFRFVFDVHAHEPETTTFAPSKSDGETLRSGKASFRIYRSKSGGNEWEALTKGLSASDCYFNILRDAMAVDSLDSCCVYFWALAWARCYLPL